MPRHWCELIIYACHACFVRVITCATTKQSFASICVCACRTRVSVYYCYMHYIAGLCHCVHNVPHHMNRLFLHILSECMYHAGCYLAVTQASQLCHHSRAAHDCLETLYVPIVVCILRLGPHTYMLTHAPHPTITQAKHVSMYNHKLYISLQEARLWGGEQGVQAPQHGSQLEAKWLEQNVNVGAHRCSAGTKGTLHAAVNQNFTTHLYTSDNT